jgi:hypothetical protein
LNTIAEAIMPREEFGRLLEILAGYPLAMEIILPNLAHRTAEELREMLTGEGVDMQGGWVSEEIFKCVNISFSLLTERARSGLLAFAPFTSFLNAVYLEKYLEALHGEGLFKDTTSSHMEDALAQAEKQGLVKEERFKKCYASQPVFPYNDEYSAKMITENPGIIFKYWEPAAAIAALECSAEAKEILRAALEEIKKAKGKR